MFLFRLDFYFQSFYFFQVFRIRAFYLILGNLPIGLFIKSFAHKPLGLCVGMAPYYYFEIILFFHKNDLF
jgi:hypothetical protein